VKNCIADVVLWVDEELEIISDEVKGRDPKITCEIIGIYRAPNEDTRAIERLAVRTGYSANSIKHSIFRGDLNLPSSDWNGNAECTSVSQVL
jgi:hypothetical protein